MVPGEGLIELYTPADSRPAKVEIKGPRHSAVLHVDADRMVLRGLSLGAWSFRRFATAEWQDAVADPVAVELTSAVPSARAVLR